MKHINIKNIPFNPKEIYDYALNKSFDFWIDENLQKTIPDILLENLVNYLMKRLIILFN